MEGEHTGNPAPALTYPVPIGCCEDLFHDVISPLLFVLLLGGFTRGNTLLCQDSLLGTPAPQQGSPGWDVLSTQLDDVLLSITCYLFTYFGLLYT